MAISSSLANHLLIAMPSLTDLNFSRTVVYLCEHQANGSVGLIINKPLEFCLDFIFTQMKLEHVVEKQGSRPLLYGGPLQTERGFVIHRPKGIWRSSLILDDDVTVTTSNDIIKALAEDAGPKDALVTLGYAGWLGDQLMEEIRNNIWLVCPCKQELLYEVPYEKRWELAALSIGVKINQLSSDVGHA